MRLVSSSSKHYNLTLCKCSSTRQRMHMCNYRPLHGQGFICSWECFGGVTLRLTCMHENNFEGWIAISKTRWKTFFPCTLTFCKSWLLFHREMLVRGMGYTVCCCNLHIYSRTSSQWPANSWAVSVDRAFADVGVCQGLGLGVQEMGRVKLGSSAGRSSQWRCRKKADSGPGSSYVYLLFPGVRERGWGEMGNNPGVTQDVDLASMRGKIFWLLKPELVRLTWHWWGLGLDTAMELTNTGIFTCF